MTVSIPQLRAFVATVDAGSFTGAATALGVWHVLPKAWYAARSRAPDMNLLMVIAVIILIPLIRAVAIVYALWPLAQRRSAYRHAPSALRFAEFLRPWSMAEIFIIGTAVALVKVAGLAAISLGPAFWAFCAMVIVTALSDNYMCKWTIWNALSTTPRS